MSLTQLENAIVIEILPNSEIGVKFENKDTILTKMCRVCLNSNCEIEILSRPEVHTKLQEYLNINVESTFQKWPVHICTICIGKLDEVEKFYCLARESEQKLFNMFGVEQTFEQVLIEPDYTEKTPINPEMLPLLIKEEDNSMEQTIKEDAVESDMDEDNDDKQEDDPNESFDISVTSFAATAVKKKRTNKRSSVLQKEMDDELIRTTISLQCNDCSYIPDTFEDLLNHCKDVHDKAGVLSCCDKQFKRRFKLLEHVQLHLNPDAFACPLCKKQFNSKYYLNDHMAIHIPEDKREFPCEKCAKRYPTKARLITHMKSHNEQLDFKCHHCDKAFNQKIVLYSHIKYVHEQTRTHICEVCAKVFKTKEAFISHQANHMVKRPPKLTCEICGGKYKNRDTLNQHILRHKRAHERYECDLCGKIFNCKKRMAAHRKYVHATVKLKCTFCEKEFKRPICLKEHMASHTGQVLYTCAFCPKHFNSNANKYSHQKAQHPVEWELAMRKKMEES